MFPALSWDATEQQLHAVMNVNFYAPVKIINGLLPRLEGGHIALVASVVSIIDGGTGYFIYSHGVIIVCQLQTCYLWIHEYPQD